ncbi:MAG: M23 family metallopeptidase [Ferruginibacter sp.]|nr:M23 family metallopeptidase [Cytophagales bacterium]
MFRKIPTLLRTIRPAFNDGKTLSQRLTNRYVLTIRNEENFAHKISYPLTYAKVVVFTTLSLVVLFSGCFYLSSTLLARWFNPVTQEQEINRRLYELSLTVDSLSEALAQKQVFMNSLDGVIKENKKILPGDTLPQMASPASPARERVPVDRISDAGAALRAEFEATGNGGAVLIGNPGKERLQDIFLFHPLRGGIISERYNARQAHYGVDMVAKKDEPVKCVADGTVLLASFTDDTGYVMAIQHRSNLVSVYKHNSVLLKKPGEFVKAGDIVAIIGNTGSLTTGPHLHFELWYNGVAVNPEAFVSL